MLECVKKIFYLISTKRLPMPIPENELKYPFKTLLIVGAPSFFFALLISLITHQYAHTIVSKLICNGVDGIVGTVSISDNYDTQSTCPHSAVAGPVWTFILALASFGFYLHDPRNLFAAAMAFINASSRIPETITVFLQLLIHNKTTLIVDESIALSLIKLKDPTISIVFMCFFSITILYLTITIIHDTKMIRWKWLVALTLFVLLIPLEGWMWRIVAPLFV